MNGPDPQLRAVVEEYRRASLEVVALWGDARGRLVKERYIDALQEALEEQQSGSAAQAEAVTAAGELGQLVGEHLQSIGEDLEASDAAMERGARATQAASETAQSALELARRSGQACDQALGLLEQAVPVGGKVPISEDAAKELVMRIAQPVLAEGAKVLSESLLEGILDVHIPEGTVERVLDSARTAGVYQRGWSAQQRGKK